MERTFGQNLRALRTERGLSQEELAAQLGTTKQVVSRYENGQRTPKVTVVEAFARRLGVPLAALLGEAAAQSGALRVPVLGYVRAGIPLTAVEDVLDFLRRNMTRDHMALSIITPKEA